MLVLSSPLGMCMQKHSGGPRELAAFSESPLFKGLFEGLFLSPKETVLFYVNTVALYS